MNELNDLDVAARLVTAIHRVSMETVSQRTRTPPPILLDMCNLARGFNRNVLHFLGLRRIYFEIEKTPEAPESAWYAVPGSPFAHRFALVGAGRHTSACGMLSREPESLQPAALKQTRCRNCERG